MYINTIMIYYAYELVIHFALGASVIFCIHTFLDDIIKNHYLDFNTQLESIDLSIINLSRKIHFIENDIKLLRKQQKNRRITILDTSSDEEI